MSKSTDTDNSTANEEESLVIRIIVTIIGGAIGGVYGLVMLLGYLVLWVSIGWFIGKILIPFIFDLLEPLEYELSSAEISSTVVASVKSLAALLLPA
ncbi:MAG: hypothetical protein ACE5EM_13325 [Sphingomonadales bacterium]